MGYWGTGSFENDYSRNILDDFVASLSETTMAGSRMGFVRHRQTGHRDRDRGGHRDRDTQRSGQTNSRKVGMPSDGHFPPLAPALELLL